MFKYTTTIFILHIKKLSIYLKRMKHLKKHSEKNGVQEEYNKINNIFI